MEELAALAASQSGLVRVDQALARGLSRQVIAGKVRRGEWRRLFRGVLATGSAALPEPALLRRGALLVTGAAGALSHTSALAEHGVIVSEERPVHVSVPVTGRLPRPRGLVVHRRAPSAPVVRRRGLALAPVEVAVVQAFAMTSEPEVGIVCAAVAGGHTTVARLRAAAWQRRGTPRLRQLLDLVELGCHSPIEIDYLVLVERAFGLPEGERQIRAAPGVRVDVLYSAAGVVVELDRAEHHASDAFRRADIRRDAALAARGLLTLRFTGRQVREESAWVASCVREVLAVRAA